MKFFNHWYDIFYIRWICFVYFNVVLEVFVMDKPLIVLRNLFSFLFQVVTMYPYQKNCSPKILLFKTVKQNYYMYVFIY
jgi:hypothetical protein